MSEKEQNLLVKVHFELPIVEEGFPPISVETLNARLLEDGSLELDNTPFFVESVASGDIMKGKKSEDERTFYFSEVVQPGGSSALSIIFIDDESQDEIKAFLKTANHYYEYGEFREFNMLAVCINSGQNYQKVINFLDEHEEMGTISYAELCVA